MDLNPSKEDLSDDEIFFGKLTIKELRRHRYLRDIRQTTSCLPVKKEQSHDKKEQTHDKSLNVIETHSDPGTSGVMEMKSPDLKSTLDSYSNQKQSKNTDSDVKSSDDSFIRLSSDDSFIRLEKMVTELCMSPKQHADQFLDNTLDVIDSILTNVPPKDNIDDDNKSKSEDKKTCLIISATSPGITEKEYAANIQADKDVSERKHDLFIMKDENTGLNSKLKMVESITPVNKSIKSPNRMKQNNEHVFKTPKNGLSCKKQTATLKKTQRKSSAYQHIRSPIAAYIRNSPQIPLVQAVHPKKPLPGVSLIPKLLKSKEIKENHQLP